MNVESKDEADTESELHYSARNNELYFTFHQVRKKKYHPPDALAYMAEPLKHVGSTAVVYPVYCPFFSNFFEVEIFSIVSHLKY